GGSRRLSWTTQGVQSQPGLNETLCHKQTNKPKRSKECLLAAGQQGKEVWLDRQCLEKSSRDCSSCYPGTL
ncbi:hypothetical protein LEMLEM_LOCUS5654, partial [Lemmus lemmus]